MNHQEAKSYAEKLTQDTGKYHEFYEIADGFFAVNPVQSDNAPPAYDYSPEPPAYFEEFDSGTVRYENESVPRTDKKTSTFKTISLKELKQKDFSANWLIEGFIERGDWGMIYGKSASCKSFFVQEACFCVAAGLPFQGKTVQQSSVLYVAGEGFSGIAKRFNALIEHHDVSPDDTLHFSEQPADFMNEQCAKNIADRVREIGNVGLIVIDTLHRNMGSGNENSAEDIGKFLYNIDTHLKNDGVANFDIARLIIHHSGIGNDDRARGSGSLYAAMEVSYRVEKDANSVVTVTNDKMKNHQPPSPMSFNIKSVADSIVLEHTDYVVKTKKQSLSDNAQKVFSVIATAMLSDAATQVPVEVIALYPDNPEFIPKRVISFDKLRELAYAVLTVDTKTGERDAVLNAKKSALTRARADLKKAGYIAVHGSDYVWAINRENAVKSGDAG